MSLSTLLKTKVAMPPGVPDALARLTTARAKSREIAEKVEGAEIALMIERQGGAGLPDHLAAKAAAFLGDRVMTEHEIEGELKRAKAVRSAAAAEEGAAREGWATMRSEIALAYRPKHDAIGRKMTKAVEALAAVIAEEQALLAEVEAAEGDRSVLTPRWLSLGVGSPDSWASPLAAWLRAHKEG